MRWTLLSRHQENWILPTLLVLLLVRSQEARKSGQLPPGPRPWPVVGSLLSTFFHKPAFRWMLRAAEGRPITCVRLGSVHAIVVNCPVIAREFLKTYDAIFCSRPITMAAEHSSHGFRTVAVTPVSDQWKKMRRALASEVVNKGTFRWQHHIRVEEADNTLRYIYHLCRASGGKTTVNVRLLARQYAGNVVRRMLFGRRHFGEGREGGGPGKEEVEHVEAAFDVLSVLYAFAVSDYFPRLRWLDLEGHERFAKISTGTINKYHDPIVEERVHMRRCGAMPEGEPEDLLDVMISLKDSVGKPLLSLDEIKGQTSELVKATVDNPPTIAEWALAEMLKAPHILKKAVEELDRVVGRERLVQESDFPNLPYVKACAREAIRLHPVAAFNLPHVSTEDATVAGFFIPKGSHVLLSPVGLGRNPQVWEDPLRYDPERHLRENNVELAEPDLRFLSFSLGRRGCMGSAVGSALAYMLLARLLQGFQWEVPPGAVLDLSEAEESLFKARPLHAVAEPRLPILLEGL